MGPQNSDLDLTQIEDDSIAPDSKQVLSEDAELDIDINSFFAVSSTDNKLEEIHLALQAYSTKRGSLEDFFKALCAIRPEAAGQDANTSALYWLSRKLTSRAVLKNLLESKALQEQLENNEDFYALFLQ